MGIFRPSIPELVYPEFATQEEEYAWLERIEQERRRQYEYERKREADPWKTAFEDEQERVRQQAEEARAAQQRKIDEFNAAEIERLRRANLLRDVQEGTNVSSTFENLVNLIKQAAVPQPAAAADPAEAEAERIRQLVAQGDIAARKIADSNKARLLREEENAWNLRAAPEQQPIRYDAPAAAPAEPRAAAVLRSILDLTKLRRMR